MLFRWQIKYHEIYLKSSTTFLVLSNEIEENKNKVNLFKIPNFRLKRKYNNSFYPNRENKDGKGLWYDYSKKKKKKVQ